MVSGCDGSTERSAEGGTGAARDDAGTTARELQARIETSPEKDRGALYVRLAGKLLGDGAADKALEAANEAARRGQDGDDLLYVRGESHRLSHDFETAESDLSALLQRTPSHRPALLSLAQVRVALGESKPALKLFDKYFELTPAGEPSFVVALLAHGRALRSAGKRVEAADRFALLLELSPHEAVGYSELAQTLYRLRRRKEARFVEELFKLISNDDFEEHVERGLRRSGNRLYALGQAAFLHRRKERFLEAFQTYEQALALQGTDSRIAMNFADLCLSFGRRRDALRALDDAIAHGAVPRSGLLGGKARVFLERADAESSAAAEAMTVLQQAIDVLAKEGDLGGLDKGQASAFSLHVDLARASVAAGRFEIASDAVKRATALQAQHWEPWYWSGRIALAARDDADALRHFVRAESMPSAKLGHEFFYHKGVALERRGDRVAAATMFKQSIQRKRDHVPALDGLLRLTPDSDPSSSGVRTALEAAQRGAAEAVALDSKLDSTPLSACGPSYLERGRLLFRFGSPRSREMLGLAVDLLPDNREALEAALRVLRRPSDMFRRIGLLGRLLRIDPTNVDAATTQAGNFLQLHVRLEEAEELSRRAYTQKPDTLRCRLLGEVLSARGNREEALKLVEAGVQQFPSDEKLAELLGRLSSE